MHPRTWYTELFKLKLNGNEIFFQKQNISKDFNMGLIKNENNTTISFGQNDLKTTSNIFLSIITGMS